MAVETGSGTRADTAAKIDHVAVAVTDLEEAVTLFTRLLGAGPVSTGQSERFGVRVAMFALGESMIELLEGTESDSPVSKFVAKKGPGLHHICYAVQDLPGTVRRLEEEGFELLGSGEDTGVEGRRVVFVHPKSSGGILSEFIEGNDTTGE